MDLRQAYQAIFFSCHSLNCIIIALHPITIVFRLISRFHWVQLSILGLSYSNFRILCDYSIDNYMGNQFCENSASNSLNMSLQETQLPTKHQRECSELEQPGDQQLLDEGTAPLKRFVHNHLNQKPICASNNLYFSAQVQQENKETSHETMMMTKLKGKKEITKRCSIDHTNMFQFESTIKDFVVTEKIMYGKQGRIQINQEKFIQLRNENVKRYYKFEEIVGEGSFGSVYRAICLKSREERAIKIIKKEGLGENKKAAVFAQLQLLKKLDHPNIIKLYEVFESKDRYHVVTEYCRGGSIIDFIKERKHFDENIVKIILKQLLGCLNYLHIFHIVHRDIKLENIVFISRPSKQSSAEEIQIKLLDFGTAFKLTRPKVRCQELIGTVSYMAPEIIKGYFTEKCDLWSCGVLLYILLTSKSPFKCKKKEDTIQKILTHEIDYSDPLWQEITDNAKNLVKKMLEKDPYRRISADQALKHSWFQSNKGKVTAKNSDFIKSLSNYYRENNLISVLESYLVFSKVSPDQRRRVNQLFKQLDRNSDGVIEKTQLIQAYKDANSGQANLDEIEYVLNKIDKDKSGCINLNEFSSVMINREKLFVKDALQSAFDYFANGTEFIQTKELSKLLEGSDSKQIQKLLGELDENSDKKISKEEFLNYLLRKGCLY